MNVRSRRSTQGTLQTVVDLPGVCGLPVTYSWWRHNSWIQTR